MKKISVIIFLLLTIPLLSLAQEQLIIEEPVCEVCPLCETCPVIPMDPLKICNDPVLEKEAEPLPCSFIPPVDNTEVPTKGSEIIELPVNAFQNSLTGWTKTGLSPYLDALDYSVNYVSITNTTASTGYYDFKDSIFDRGTISKVELKIYCKWSDVPETAFASFYIRNGSTFVNVLAYDTCTTSWAWQAVDITSIANLSIWNFTTLNNTQMYIAFQGNFDAKILYIDTVKLTVEYTPISVGADPTKELITSESTEAEFYLDKTINYGDIIVIVFLSLFLIGTICKVIYDFVFNRD